MPGYGHSAYNYMHSMPVGLNVADYFNNSFISNISYISFKGPYKAVVKFLA